MKKSIILSIVGLIAVFGALLVFSGEEERAPRRDPPPARQVTKAPEPPPPVAEETAVVEDPALKDALLGLNKKPEVAKEQPPPPPKPVVRRRARPAAAAEAIEEPEPPVELGLSDDDFQATVGSWSGVKSCLVTNSSRGDETMTGAIQVAFTIHTDGNVVESKVVDASNDEARSLAPCVERKARRIRFPTFAGNQDVTKTAKFVF